MVIDTGDTSFPFFDRLRYAKRRTGIQLRINCFVPAVILSLFLFRFSLFDACLFNFSVLFIDASTGYVSSPSEIIFSGRWSDHGFFDFYGGFQRKNNRYTYFAVRLFLRGSIDFLGLYNKGRCKSAG